MMLIQREGFDPGGMWFIPFLCIAICIFLFFVFRRGGRGPFFSDRTRCMDKPDNGNSSAIDILNSRYAKGEISKEE